MWWDVVWAGCRLDPGVCPIYKHTNLDITCGVNKIKVLPKGVMLKLFKLINYMNSPTIVLTLFSYMLSQVMHRFKHMLLDCMLGGLDRGPSDFGKHIFC